MRARGRVGLFAAFEIILLFTVFNSSHFMAQPGPRGQIQGKVKDPTGSPISAAKIALVNAQLALIAATETEKDGTFLFQDVPVGSYAVTASRSDFGSQRASAQVYAATTSPVDLVLEISPLSYRVTVTTEFGQVQDKDRVAQQVNIISEDAIRQRAQGLLAQVANEEVGVALQRTSSTIGGIFVRGLTGKNVAVYLDGVRYSTSTGRGGINTFFDLNEPSSLRSVEILRGPNSAQYGSDSLGGTVQLISNLPPLGLAAPAIHGEINTFFASADHSLGGNTLFTYGSKKIGLSLNLASRRVNILRSANGRDGHAAVTRFLGVPSSILGDRLPDTAFTQYGGTLHLNYSPAVGQQFILHYQRSQQEGGKRYDQLLGGDGNPIADLRNLMLDFFYGRYDQQGWGLFDNASFTVSYNTQREERVNQGGQGNPLASITTQYERTKVLGVNLHMDKQWLRGNSFLVGADMYRETVIAPAYTFSPPTGVVRSSRPRVPGGGRYLSYGFYAQDVDEIIPSRVRLSAAIRYNVASYLSRSANSPFVNDQPLFPNDSLRVSDFSGRAGVVITPIAGVEVVFNYSRGFRAPNITDLGTLGLTGDGFEVASVDLSNLHGTVGTTADEKAVSSGSPISPQRSELSNNYDLGLRWHNHWFDTDLTGFLIDLKNTITKQALILPPGAVGLFLGDQPVVRQLPNGVVFVPLSSSPVLARANFSDARVTGLEYTLRIHLNRTLSWSGNFTYLYEKDKATGLPPNIEGGTPPSTGFLRLRYAPPNKPFWIEAHTTLSDRQSRLSSLDLSDRRTGAMRSRTSIANFFNNGARVRGLTGSGPDGRFGTPDDILLVTGETLTQIQNRLLGEASSGPLYSAIPGYGLLGLRGGFHFGEKSEILFALENMTDKSYRGLSWGMDGPGRSFSVQYRYSF